jgi:hypothetical protein
MSSTDSDGLEKVVGIPPELVVGLVQNEWTASIRIDGRHEPEHASNPSKYLFGGKCPG